MKKIIITVIVLILFAAFITNPNQLQHENVIVKDIMKEFNNRYTFNDNEYHIVNTQYFNAYKAEVEQYSNYNNYLLFSTTTDFDERMSIGLFGSVITDINKEEWFKVSDSIMKLHNKVNKMQKTVDNKRTKKKKTTTGTYPIKINSIRTGFGATTRNWKPAVLINVKNLTNKDLTDYISMKAVFIDTKDGKQIGEKTKYVSSEFITLIADSNKDMLFVCPQGYKGSPTSLRLKARLYFKGKFIKEVKIDPTELR